MYDRENYWLTVLVGVVGLVFLLLVWATFSLPKSKRIAPDTIAMEYHIPPPFQRDPLAIPYKLTDPKWKLVALKADDKDEEAFITEDQLIITRPAEKLYLEFRGEGQAPYWPIELTFYSENKVSP